MFSAKIEHVSTCESVPKFYNIPYNLNIGCPSIHCLTSIFLMDSVFFDTSPADRLCIAACAPGSAAGLPGDGGISKNHDTQRQTPGPLSEMGVPPNHSIGYSDFPSTSYWCLLPNISKYIICPTVLPWQTLANCKISSSVLLSRGFDRSSLDSVKSLSKLFFGSFQGLCMSCFGLLPWLNGDGREVNAHLKAYHHGFKLIRQLTTEFSKDSVWPTML